MEWGLLFLATMASIDAEDCRASLTMTKGEARQTRLPFLLLTVRNRKLDAR